MGQFEDVVAALRGSLLARGYDLALSTTDLGGTRREVKVTFPSAVIADPIIAIPDVHLGDGTPGDVFLASPRDKVGMLTATLAAVRDYLQQNANAYALQLGDWFDVWRAIGTDARGMGFAKIENVPAYRPLFELDKQIGLLHLIGNHDASFLYALPDRRVADPSAFRLGYWMGDNVYALHGHQLDLAPPPNTPSDIGFVTLATAIAKIVPTVVSVEQAIDRGHDGARDVPDWISRLFGLNREDPQPKNRPALAPPVGWGGSAAPFVDRENRDNLVAITDRLLKSEPTSSKVDLLLVGHSHGPCISWATSNGRGNPVVLVDAGSFAYNQSNVLVAAGDTAAVFDVV